MKIQPVLTSDDLNSIIEHMGIEHIDMDELLESLKQLYWGWACSILTEDVETEQKRIVTVHVYAIDRILQQLKAVKQDLQKAA